MGDGDRLQEILANPNPDTPQPGNNTIPPQYQPSAKVNPKTGEGEVSANAREGEQPDWAAQLEHLGLDPECHEVFGDYIEVRSWDAAVGDGRVQRMRYVKARVRLRDPSDDGWPDSRELAKWIRRAKPRRPATSEGCADVLCLSDWQIGKAGEKGGGTPETIERVVDTIGRMQDRIRANRRAGRHASELHIAGMGDLTERCWGHYASQRFTVDLNEREQKRTARWLLTKVVRELAPEYSRVVASAVASNHGENRGPDGKQVSTPDDSLDLELFENVAETFRENPDAFGHVEFPVSPDPLVLAWNVQGVPVAHMHAHTVKKVSKPIYGLWDWWTGAGFGDQPTEIWPGLVVGDRPAGRARILVTAHYHHHFQLWQQGRVLLGCPAVDGGSRWLEDSSNIWSEPGTLVFSVERGLHRPVGVELL